MQPDRSHLSLVDAPFVIDAKSVIDRIETIGTVPTSVTQIFTLVNDPRANSSDFERVVRPDVGLTANLLRCANSVFYRGSREITSVRDAINRMGLRRVFEVAASASFVRAIPARLTGYGLESKSYWGHSVAVAVLSDRIGRAAGFTYPDLAFTAGLLHDLGKVVIASFLNSPGMMAKVGMLDGALTNIEDEHRYLGIDHAVLGEQLAVKWNLPKDIVAAARWHHAPQDAPTATMRDLATVVQVADGASHVAGFGESDGERIDLSALDRLNLEAEAVMAIVEKAKAEIERTREMLMGTSRAA